MSAYGQGATQRDLDAIDLDADREEEQCEQEPPDFWEKVDREIDRMKYEEEF